MRKSSKLIAGVCAMAFSTGASASNWWFIGWAGNKPTRIVTLIDKESIRRLPDGKYRAWGHVYYEDQRDKIATAKVLDEYDCVNETMRRVSYIMYDTADEVHKTETFTAYQTPPKPVAPETIGYSEMKFACGEPEASAFEIGEVPNFRIGGRALLKSMDEDASAK